MLFCARYVVRLCSRMHGTVSPEIYFSCGRTKEPTCMKNTYFKVIFRDEDFDMFANCEIGFGDYKFWGSKICIKTGL